MKKSMVFALLVALTLGLVAPAVTRAQSGTPETSEATGSFGIPLGTTVTIVGSDGAPAGTIAVTNITDPFQGYDSSSAPQRGYHYALAEVTVTNTSSAPMPFDPSVLEAIDTEGFVADQPYMTFTDASVTPLEYTDALAPGASLSGVVPYSLFGSATIARMAYAPSYERFIDVLDLRAAPVAPGTAVSIMGTEGSEIAQVTVNSVTAPYTGYDTTTAPPRGSSYVALDVTVTNTSAAVLSVSPADFWVIDADGFVLTSAYVSRTDTTVPDYSYLDMNPGDSQHGMLFYAVFEGVPVAQVAYGDGYTTLNVVADLSAGAGTQTATTTTGQAQAPVAPTVAAPPTAAAVPTTATVASSAECAGVVEWGTDMADRIGRAAGLVLPFQTTDVSTLDPATVRDVATQMRAMGDEQAASNPPPAAVDINTILTEDFYYALADAIDQIADALEQKNAAGALAGQMAAMQVVKVFDEGGAYYTAADALTAACPAEIQQLDAL